MFWEWRGFADAMAATPSFVVDDGDQRRGRSVRARVQCRTPFRNVEFLATLSRNSQNGCITGNLFSCGKDLFLKTNASPT